MEKCISCGREQFSMTEYLVDGKCFACREGFVLTDEDYYGEEKTWIAVDCFDRSIKVYLESQRFDEIYSDDEIKDWIAFKKAIENAGGVIKDNYS